MAKIENTGTMFMHVQPLASSQGGSISPVPTVQQGVYLQRGTQISVLILVDAGKFRLVRSCHLAEEAVGAAVAVVVEDDLLARLDETSHGGECCHARAEREGLVSLLKLADLQHGRQRASTSS